MQIDLVPQLGSAAIRAFGLGLLTFLASFLFRIRSPAALHAAWTVVLAGMLLQIPLGVLAPAVRLTALQTLSYSGPPRVVESAGAFSPALQSVTRTSRAHTEPNGRRLSLSEVFTGLYLGVSMLLFARMGLGAWGLHRILRDAKPIPSVGPGVLESRSFVVPASAGCFRAKIFLPPAWSDWGAGKLRAVLAHERAHITRQDWLIRVASHVNVCLFWFHPLAWWMERELARLAEEACDDIALSAIGNREDYAEALVDIARAAADSSLTWEIISMAKESNVTRRVNRILEARLPAPKPFGRLAWVTLLACSVPAIYLSAAVKFSPASPEPAVSKPAAASPHSAQEARLPLLPERKSTLKRIAQAPPNQSLLPAPAVPPSRPEDPPVSMCVLIDNSGSIRDKRAEVKAAALALVKAAKPDDEVCIVNFNDEVYIDLAFTSDHTKMQEAFIHIDSRGGKAMRDAIPMAVDHVEKTARNNRRALVLITEGNDSASKMTEEQLLSKIRNSGIPVYCIGLLNEEDPARAGTARLALQKLAEISGGFEYYPRNVADLESISSKIADDLRRR